MKSLNWLFHFPSTDCDSAPSSSFPLKWRERCTQNEPKSSSSHVQYEINRTSADERTLIVSYARADIAPKAYYRPPVSLTFHDCAEDYGTRLPSTVCGHCECVCLNIPAAGKPLLFCGGGSNPTVSISTAMIGEELDRKLFKAQMRKKTCHIELINASRCLRNHVYWSRWMRTTLGHGSLKGGGVQSGLLGLFFSHSCRSIASTIKVGLNPRKETVAQRSDHGILIWGSLWMLFSKNDTCLLQASGRLADGSSRVLSGPIITRFTCDQQAPPRFSSPFAGAA